MNTALKPLTIPPLSDRLGYGKLDTIYNNSTNHLRKFLMQNEKDLYSILTEWFPDGNYNEQQLWDAIAEANGMDYSEIADGDLAEWL